MDRPVLYYVDTTTWAATDMKVVDVVPAEESLRDLGMDIHADIYVGAGEYVPIVFLTTHDRSVKHFRRLIGTTVPIEMIGWHGKKGGFEPDMLRLYQVRALRKAWYTPRVRPV